ncbi:MAG: transglutaminase domain-containing protein [Thermoguttaceae bacterium]
MTKTAVRAATFVAALTLTACLCASIAYAQISFGKMRDASEKGTAAPTLEEAEAALNVSSEGKASDKPAPSKSPEASGRTTVVPPAQGSGANAARNSVEERTSAAPSTSRTARPTLRPNATAQTARTPAPTAVGKPVGENGNGPLLGRAVSHKYRAGMIFQAQPGGTCVNVFGSAPVPMEFPEQKTRILEEEFPKSAKVDYRDLKEGGARQLVFKMRELRGGNGVQASALFEVTRYPLMPPTDPAIYTIPKTVPTEIRRYLRNGKYMESNTRTIRTLARETTDDIDSAWDKVDAILSFVRDNIQYKDVLIEKPMRGALAALKTREGDCEDMSALFISMCRAINVPARLVRVPGHCWAEFYLIDDEKQGFWFPAQVAGTEELGSLQDTRVILQKGDSFKIPEEPKEEQLYVKELFMGVVKDGGPDPKYQFIQETDGR